MYIVKQFRMDLYLKKKSFLMHFYWKNISDACLFVCLGFMAYQPL